MKILAREFIWGVLSFILAFPIAFIFIWAMNMTTDSGIPNLDERIFLNQLFIIGLVLGFFSIYIIRMIKGAISILVSQKK